ncbi:MAG: hypothetical protein M0P58_11010 [Bacteroidales bacterium]|nr:hypothetical protein [Bacteroidales bacterium]
MKIFRKFRFLFIIFFVLTFLPFPGYSGTFTLEQISGDGIMKFDQLHAFSLEYLIPNIERIHHFTIPPMVKCFPERQAFNESMKIAPCSIASVYSPDVSYIINTILLSQICKLQI